MEGPRSSAKEGGRVPSYLIYSWFWDCLASDDGKGHARQRARSCSRVVCESRSTVPVVGLKLWRQYAEDCQRVVVCGSSPHKRASQCNCRRIPAEHARGPRGVHGHLLPHCRFCIYRTRIVSELHRTRQVLLLRHLFKEPPCKLESLELTSLYVSFCYFSVYILLTRLVRNQ